ncbi:hypothetical protein HGB07_09570, partial [Candidatus Roizmanbacteria bacterium]|nr:hypothetical protein [Candidatus Roizmanbacteria bacterium]
FRIKTVDLPKVQAYNVVQLKVGDMGFFQHPTIDQIYKKVHELGLVLCPAEVGPQYALQYSDLEHDKSLVFGMEPIADLYNENVARVFSICGDKFYSADLPFSLHAVAIDAYDATTYGPDTIFVFGASNQET